MSTLLIHAAQLMAFDLVVCERSSSNVVLWWTSTNGAHTFTLLILLFGCLIHLPVPGTIGFSLLGCLIDASLSHTVHSDLLRRLIDLPVTGTIGFSLLGSLIDASLSHTVHSDLLRRLIDSSVTGTIGFSLFGSLVFNSMALAVKFSSVGSCIIFVVCAR